MVALPGRSLSAARGIPRVDATVEEEDDALYGRPDELIDGGDARGVAIGTGELNCVLRFNACEADVRHRRRRAARLAKVAATWSEAVVSFPIVLRRERRAKVAESRRRFCALGDCGDVLGEPVPAGRVVALRYSPLVRSARAPTESGAETAGGEQEVELDDRCRTRIHTALGVKVRCPAELVPSSEPTRRIAGLFAVEVAKLVLVRARAETKLARRESVSDQRRGAVEEADDGEASSALAPPASLRMTWPAGW